MIILSIRVSEVPGLQNVDWQLWIALDPANGRVYGLDTGAPFVWSPVAAWIMAAVPYLGYWPWAALHVAALVLLRSPLLIIMVLCSWGFWMDLSQGNTLTFVFVAGVLAVRGNRAASLLSIVMVALMPRPLQLPLAAWLLWKQPAIRIPSAVILSVHAVLVLFSGQLGEWMHAMVSYRYVSEIGYNLGPTQFFGLAWLAVGIPLAVWFTRRGMVGWAGLALCTYILPQYYLLAMLRSSGPAGSSPSSPAGERPSDG